MSSLSNLRKLISDILVSINSLMKINQHQMDWTIKEALVIRALAQFLMWHASNRKRKYQLCIVTSPLRHQNFASSKVLHTSSSVKSTTPIPDKSFTKMPTTTRCSSLLRIWTLKIRTCLSHSLMSQTFSTSRKKNWKETSFGTKSKKPWTKARSTKGLRAVPRTPTTQLCRCEAASTKCTSRSLNWIAAEASRPSRKWPVTATTARRLSSPNTGPPTRSTSKRACSQDPTTINSWKTWSAKALPKRKLSKKRRVRLCLETKQKAVLRRASGSWMARQQV